MGNQYETAGREHAGRYVAYYRVSTARQGESGLGLEAQRAAVAAYLNGGDWTMVDEFTEVESAKGGQQRPELDAAIALARQRKATLLIAKLDRLSRNLHFITALMESGCKFVAVDMPHANKLTVQLLAVMAEHERDAISTRTKAALAARKARGLPLGNPANLTPGNDSTKRRAAEFAEQLRPTFEAMRGRGLTQKAMATELNRLNIPTAQGGAWQATQVVRVLKRLAA